MINYEKLAKYMISEFSKQIRPKYIEYFKCIGFTRDNILNPEVLFKFMAIISYDMRPLSYEQVWGLTEDHREFNGNSIRQVLDEIGITLSSVNRMSENELRQRLKTAFVKNQRFGILYLDKHNHIERQPAYYARLPNVDHAKGLKQLASKIDKICDMFKKLELTGDILSIYCSIQNIHGFGRALSAKTILFIVRCFGVGFNKCNPEDMKKVAYGLFNEYWVKKGIKKLQSKGVDVEVLMDKLTEHGDPFAIEYLYLLETPEDWQRLFTHALR